MPENSASSDRMRERVPGASRWFWFLTAADRRLVAGAFLFVLAATVVLAGTLHPVPARTLLTRGDPAETLFNALAASTITGVTIVLTLGQLVLGQELGAVGDQRERMAGALAFRDDVADAVDADAPPAEPAAVLRSLVAATASSATALREATARGDLPEDAEDAVDHLVDSVTGNAAIVSGKLEGASFGEFEVVRAALDYDYSWKLHATDRVQRRWGDELGADAGRALADLNTTLELFGSAREHFKTLYVQWELSALSRTLLYAALPALAAAIVGQLLVDPRDLTGSLLGVDHALLLVTALATLAVAPFAILLAYVLRIVTVTQRTLAIGPFILRETDRAPTTNAD